MTVPRRLLGSLPRCALIWIVATCFLARTGPGTAAAATRSCTASPTHRPCPLFDARGRGLRSYGARKLLARRITVGWQYACSGGLRGVTVEITLTQYASAPHAGAKNLGTVVAVRLDTRSLHGAGSRQFTLRPRTKFISPTIFAGPLDNPRLARACTWHVVIDQA